MSGCDDADVGLVCGGEDGCGVEHEGFAGLDSEAGCTGCLHGLDGGDADYGDVEAHVLIWLGDLYDGEGAAQGGGWLTCRRLLNALSKVGRFGAVRIAIGLAVGVSWGVEGAEESAGAGDGGVGAFHGLDGDAGLGGDNDGLAEVVGGDGLGYGASVGDVLLFFFVGGAGGEDARLCEEGLQVGGGRDELDAFVAEDFCDCAEEHVGVAGAEVEEKLGESPVGTDAGEDLLVFDLAGHDGSGDAFGLEGFDETGEFAEGEPVDVDVGVGGGAGVDLGVGFFFDGGDDYGEVVSARGVEEEKGEASVAGDEAEFWHSLYSSACGWD